MELALAAMCYFVKVVGRCVLRLLSILRKPFFDGVFCLVLPGAFALGSLTLVQGHLKKAGS